MLSLTSPSRAVNLDHFPPRQRASPPLVPTHNVPSASARPSLARKKEVATERQSLSADRGGKAAQSYLWTYHAPNQKMILFDFNLSRGRDSPDAFFPKPWSGILQSDGYELYRALIRDRKNITHIGCMAHLRRHLVDAIEGGGAPVVALLADIGKLYGLEKRARENSLSHSQRACL